MKGGFSIGIVLVLACLMSGCQHNPYRATDKVYRKLAKQYAATLRATPPELQQIDSLPKEQQSFIGTVNMGIRRANYVIIHHTAQDSVRQTLKTFTMPSTQVSAHYVVGRDGRVIQMVNDYLRAQHAGESRWGTTTDLNSSSIGIELDNNGSEPYADAQIQSLLALLETLKRRYRIPVSNFIGHADIAPTRKPDPSNFPWKLLAEKGYGFWYDEPLLPPPPEFDILIALRIIGYDIRNPEAALVAFKRHFIQTDITPVATDFDRAVLFNVYRKYL